MADVLLINPYVLSRHAPRVASYRPYPPLGLMYLGAVLEDAGYDVEIYDGTFADGPDRIRAHLKRAPIPRVAGVYAMNSFRDDAIETIEHLKELGVTVFAGGPDPSIYDGEYLAGGVDVVVRGEGEAAILELLQAFSVRPKEPGFLPRRPKDEALLTIPGVSFVDRDVRHRRAPDRPASGSMDELPVPAYGLVDLERYAAEWRRVHGYASLQFMTSRGCPFACTWCARPIFGRKYRQYSAVRAADEIEHLISRYGIDHLWLFDDTFVVRREWVESFSDTLIARGLAQRIRWECLARTDLVDYSLLERMRAAGCERINFGFESGSQRVLDGMKKGTTVVDAKRVAADMHRLGMTLGGYVLFGYPGEEWSDIRATIDLVREMAPVDYSTSVAHPMPGTEFFDLVRDFLKDPRSLGWAAQDPDAVQWEAPHSSGFYRILESLLHAEYDLGLEFRLRSWVKARVLDGVLSLMRAAGDGRERVFAYRDPRFQGWKGLRSPDMSRRHRAGHQRKSEAARKTPLHVVTS